MSSPSAFLRSLVAVPEHWIRPARLALWIVLLIVSTPLRAGQWVQQTFALQAGWNALWLEVEPTNGAIEQVFGSLPIESAWTFRTRESALDFIQDASEPVWNRDRWLSWVPTGQPGALANELFVVNRHRAYLVKLTAAANLVVTGTPALRSTTWVPDAYNLRGFPVDPGAPPTFEEFFSPSAAHFDAVTRRLQPIYRLSSAGAWQLVSGSDQMESGVAYWVFSRGGSDFSAPFRAEMVLGLGELDFGLETGEFELRTHNLRGTPLTATVAELGAPGPTALAVAGSSNVGERTWTALPGLLSRPHESGQGQSLVLAARRQSITSLVYESVLELRDNVGTRHLVPVRIRRAPANAQQYVGLWMGVAVVDRVSEAHSGTLTTVRQASDGSALEVQRTGVSATPTPTRSPFNLRLLVHVGADGTVRLLREVTQMWQDGTYRVNGEGLREVDTPGRFVLVTDPSRLGEYKGIAAKDDTLTGRRLSSIGFDFPGSGAGNRDNFLPLGGTFAVGNTVSGNIRLDPDFATHPFRHKYHPDHDNFGPLTERPPRFKEEAFGITREFSLEFAATDPGTGVAVPDYGYGHIAGTYRESVTGLHREPIRASGTFRLKRIAAVSELNP